jgi:tight adherence protein B
MIALAAVTSKAAPLLLFAPVALVALRGVWLLASSAARRSALVVRSGAELRRRPRLDQRLNARLVRTRRGADLAAKLHSAGIERTAAQFVLTAVASAAGAGLIASLLFPSLLAIVVGVVVIWGWWAWLQRKLDRRKEEFVSQLPEVARLLSNGASAGLSLPATIELAVRELDDPARDELQTVIDELGLGRSLDESLASLQRRLPSREISVLMSTLIIQQRTGGDAVRALHDLSDTLDTRRETLREVRTLMAGAVFTSYTVPVLGVGALVLLNAINSNTLNRMTSEPLGIAALIVAGSLYVVGSFAIRRVARVEL